MSKSHLSAMSSIMSIIITVCVFLSVPGATEALSTLSGDGIVVKLLLMVKGILGMVLPFFAYLVIASVVLKIINSIVCTKGINAVCFVIDVITFVLSIVILRLNLSLFSWIALTVSIITLMIDFIFPHAEL